MSFYSQHQKAIGIISIVFSIGLLSHCLFLIINKYALAKLKDGRVMSGTIRNFHMVAIFLKAIRLITLFPFLIPVILVIGFLQGVCFGLIEFVKIFITTISEILILTLDNFYSICGYKRLSDDRIKTLQGKHIKW